MPIDYFNDNAYYEPEPEELPPDPAQGRAIKSVYDFFNHRRSDVFYSRQIEVQNEGEFFHWVTNRAIRELVERGDLLSETWELRTGSEIKLIWHHSNRYYKRKGKRVVELVEEFASPDVTRALGSNAEMLIQHGFAKSEFVMKGENTKAYAGKLWRRTEHDLDFIFERDGVGYGVEVKNKLGYMDEDEMKIKIEMCQELDIRPVFAARMLPKSWINRLYRIGGFGLIFKYQLYPLALKGLAKRVREELELPADSPRVLEDGTMKRFVDWHEKNV